MSKKVGLYFGSFDPIHIGHLIIANYMANYTDLDQVWFVVSPLNPLKKHRHLIADQHRLQMVYLAIRDNEKLYASNVEFDMPKPSYTIDTLEVLEAKHPDLSFSLIMGEDNLRTLHKWKAYKEIIERLPILVYPRDLADGEDGADDAVEIPAELTGANIRVCEAPLMKISSTFIRRAIQNHQDVRYLLVDEVVLYIANNYLYENRP